MSISGNHIRQEYLDFFQKNDHAIVPSGLLVPENDPTTLFTTAGMQWMLPYLLGNEHPQGNRISNSQKCLRAADIDEVGDNRHTTFFEMLGNWSLGDYFRQEQLSWVYDFLTKKVGLDPHRLYVTAFISSDKFQIPRDEDTIKIWQNLFSKDGVEAQVVTDPMQQGVHGRIFLYRWENWWSRAGEPDNMPVGEPGGPDSEVFYDFGSEFHFHENSSYADQPCHVNCDCGRFLEIGNSVFMQYQKTKTGFKELPQKNIDFGGGLERITAAANNEPDVFKTDLFWPIIERLSGLTGLDYRAHQENFRVITDHIKASVMLIADGAQPSNKDQGYMVRRLLRRAIRFGKLMGVEQSFLSDLVQPVVAIYRGHYSYLKNKQESITRIVAKESKKFEKTLNRGLKKFDDLLSQKEKLTGQIAFDLYQTYGFPLEMSIEEAQRQNISLDSQLRSDFKQAQEEHARQSRSGAAGKFKGGLADESNITTQYHTVTHLLHAALRKVLGDHVQQKGSNINAQRLRFDFSHPQAVDDKQIQELQQLINDWIQEDLLVSKSIMSKEEALQSGALAFFSGKYPDEVSVYTIGDKEDWVSKELCGGPHVKRTSEIQPIEIYKEKSASSGVRRIYARRRHR